MKGQADAKQSLESITPTGWIGEESVMKLSLYSRHNTVREDLN